MSRQEPPDTCSPHLSSQQVRTLVDQLAPGGEPRRDNMTRLAWRPAWAIRSRQGALHALMQLFQRRV